MMKRPDAVLKVGGSLSRGSGLGALCREISRQGRHHSLVVVPGGGEFADQVRKAYRKYNPGETAAHCMALLAMDQYGYLLHHMIEGSFTETGLSAAAGGAGPGRVAVLLPSGPVLQDDSLPHSWQVTSDTVAAWVARETGSSSLVLLKDVDGLCASPSPEDQSREYIREMTVDRLAGYSGGVDEYLCRFLASTCLETWIVNGLRPERIGELLDSGSTKGTRIVPDFR